MNTDLYIYVNTNVCYKINMFAYRVVETIKNISIMKVGGKKSLEHNGLEPASCHTAAAGSAIDLPGQSRSVRIINCCCFS